jgi:hypothetical protein
LRSKVPTAPTVRSGLELLLAANRAGVCERGDLVREEAVSARPRVWLGSREAEGGVVYMVRHIPGSLSSLQKREGSCCSRHKRSQHGLVAKQQETST